MTGLIEGAPAGEVFPAEFALDVLDGGFLAYLHLPLASVRAKCRYVVWKEGAVFERLSKAADRNLRRHPVAITVRMKRIPPL